MASGEGKCDLEQFVCAESFVSGECAAVSGHQGLDDPVVPGWNSKSLPTARTALGCEGRKSRILEPSSNGIG